MQNAKLGLGTCFCLFLLLACGGGGGGGGGGGNNSGPTTSPPPASLEPTWSLSEASPAQVDLSQTEVDAVLDHVFTDQAVQAALLVKDGYAVGQRFSSGVDASTLGTSWSVAKSFYAAAIGIAINEGWISSLDQPASDFLTEWADTDKASITIRNILEMRAGFAENSSIFYEDDQTQFAINFPKANPEGVNFTYSNPNSQLMEPLLLRATGLDAHSYLKEKIMTPIGIDINLVGLWRDPADANPLTYMGIDATAFDMARFGLLFARGGEWDGQQIVPTEFVTTSLSAQSDFYGLQWWILNSAFFAGQTPPITIAAALGLNGQKIYVWQDQDIVLVVQTKYAHSANQGYVLSDTNYPNTCTARNTCPTSTGEEVPAFDELQLMTLLQALVE